MPGPKSDPRPPQDYRDDVREARGKVKPNRKAAKRLETRVAAATPVQAGKWARGFRKPGSQNRNK